jgi:NADH dehydrogenase FAD-containing subunit
MLHFQPSPVSDQKIKMATNGHANGINGTNGAKPERIIKTDLTQYAQRRRTGGPYADNLDLDVLIVGAGFSGVYMLYEMRKAGYKTTLYDAGLGYGGTW